MVDTGQITKKIEVQYINKKGQKKWKSTSDDKIYNGYNYEHPRKPSKLVEHKHERKESLTIKYRSNEPKLRKIGELGDKVDQIKYITKLLQESIAHCPVSKKRKFNRNKKNQKLIADAS